MRGFVLTLLLWMLLLAAAPQAHAVPYFEFGVHDDGALVFNRGNQYGLYLHRSAEIGGQWQRTILYHGRSWRLYDRGIRRARRQHQQVQMVIACNGRVWEEQAFERYVQRVVRHFRGVVHRWSICNEPNQPGWLKPMENLSLAATYRLLYRVGYAAVKRLQPHSQVFFGEFSSNYHPLDFMRQVFCTEGNLDDTCVSLQADCVAYHPYQLENPQAASKTPFTVGIGSISLLTDLMDELVARRLLLVSQGGVAPLCITEIAYQSRAIGHLASRNLPDEVRKIRWREILSIACESVYIRQVIAYQMFPNAPYRQTRWDSSIVGRSGHPDKTFYAIKNWRKSYPECMR